MEIKWSAVAFGVATCITLTFVCGLGPRDWRYYVATLILSVGASFGR